MFKLDSRLAFLAAVFGALTLIMSCSQTEDITASKSLTKIWLSPERLPEPPPGMIYGVWVSKVAYPEIKERAEVIPLGRFSYLTSDTLVAFLDENGNVRADSNLFQLEGDLFEFDFLFVTVEVDGSYPSLPGPVMLMQSITGRTDTIRMSFPQHDSLFEATIRCNFETPTDDNRGNDGYGLWFCNYQPVRLEIEDTLDVLIKYVWDTIEVVTNQEGPSDPEYETLNFASLYAPYADSVWFEFDTILVDFGRDVLALGIDSFIHYAAKQNVHYDVDSTIPRIIKDYGNDIDTISPGDYDTISGIFPTTVRRSVFVDVFVQDLYSIPDLSDYGWRYKGWVVADHIPKAAVGEFTPPAWDFTTGELLIPGYRGGLLTTGPFVDETDNDLSNPFTLEVKWVVDSGSFYDTVLKRPRFPGEDFLDGAALSAATGGVITTPYNLLQDLSANTGTVFVSIEPINLVHDSTNFPIIIFARNLPSSWPAFEPVFGTFLNVWSLRSQAGLATGAQGLPKITAKIQRL
ncbi:MAG: hypothetical protein AB1772_06500 [Candidatus Zixiibacteriota bacterium]